MAKLTRRDFFRQCAAGVAVPWFVSGTVLGKDNTAPPSQRITVGHIGVRNRGGDLFRALLGYPEITRFTRASKQQTSTVQSQYPDAQVVAVADVDKEVRDACAAETDRRYGKPCRLYADFRKMLDCKDVDAVCIATPDHWHAIAVIMACEAGKDIYCEKPLSHTIAEGRAMANAVRRCERIFQTGSQQRSCSGFRLACELVRNGRLGKVHTIEVGLGRAPGGGGPDSDPPSTIDWDFWLGPAPWRHYNSYIHRMPHRGWRWMWDYSGGQMTNWGAHHLDIAQWAMGTDHTGPVTVEGEGTLPAEGLYEVYLTYHVVYQYANGIVVDCSSGHPVGVRFRGRKGTLYVRRHGNLGDRIHVRSKGPVCDPPDLADAPLRSSDVRLYASTNHLRNWLDCIRSRRPPICDVEIGHRSCTVAHLGNIAMKLGRKLRWDPKAEQFIGDEEANRMTTSRYRTPWHL